MASDREVALLQAKFSIGWISAWQRQSIELGALDESMYDHSARKENTNLSLAKIQKKLASNKFCADAGIVF